MKLNKRRLLIMSLSMIMVACGGGQNDSSFDSVESTSIINQPQGTTPFFVRDEPSNTHEENTLKDAWSFSVRHQGADIVSKDIENNADTIKKIGRAHV